MAKTKLTWKFPQTIFTVTVLPSELARTHQDTPRPLVLRTCLYGYNEQGVHVKTLYCTRSARFFTQTKDGWRELLPCTNRVRREKKNRSLKSGGDYDSAFLRDPQHYLNVNCYRLIAYAWCEHPEEAKTDPEWYKYGHGFEVDHLNGDHSDSSPENLRWLKSEQNRAWDKRCGREQYKDGAHKGKTLRGIGLQPKHITYENLRQISELSDIQFEAWLDKVQEIMNRDTSEMSVDSINTDIVRALGWVRIHTLHCDHCGGEMIDGYDHFHRLHDGSIICDLCYDDLYA